MLLLTFTQCFLSGIVVASPAGPLMLIAGKHMLEGHIKKSIGIGLGSILADSTACVLALSGSKTLLLERIMHAPVLKWAISFFALGAGFYYLKTSYAQPTTADQKKHSFHTSKNTALEKTQHFWLFFLIGFGITFFNPLTLIGVFSVLHIFNVLLEGSSPEVLVWFAFLKTTCFSLGCLAWWTLILSSIYRLKKQLSQTTLQWINWGMGWMLCLLGGYALSKSFTHLLY